MPPPAATANAASDVDGSDARFSRQEASAEAAAAANYNQTESTILLNKMNDKAASLKAAAGGLKGLGSSPMRGAPNEIGIPSVTHKGGGRGG
jgi:hypothetical protein